MQLDPDEPWGGPWTPTSEPMLLDEVHHLLGPADRALILVDGRSGGGKSTFAARLSRLLDAPVVATDDIAWHLHPTDWAIELVTGVLEPWRRGEEVTFRPPGWVARSRPGAVCVPAGPRLVVEGVGAGRRELAGLADLVVWVQSDRSVARTRGIARDVEQGRTPGEAELFWDEWAQAEDPFLAADRPWTRARLIVNGTPDKADCGTTQLARGPLARHA